MTATVPAPPPADAAVRDALATVAGGAAARDQLRAVPRFPGDAFGALESAGMLAATLPPPDGQPALTASAELALVRAVAAADASVGRIFDGHLNAVERLLVQAPASLRDEEIAAVRACELRLGVWGADPAPGEGAPATLRAGRLEGVKVFCSGAGGLDRAIVLVREAGDERPVHAAYVDLSEGVEVDEDWYRGAGMRASASHRVVFDRTPVLGILGGPGALTAEPWFSHDAIRTAATWAGIADSATAAALDILAARPDPGQLEGLAAGRIQTAQGTIDLWVSAAGRRLDSGLADEHVAFVAHMRDAIATAARAIVDEATRATGSRPLAGAGTLDRARRDLDVFLLQHRLEPIVAAVGLATLAEVTE